MLLRIPSPTGVEHYYYYGSNPAMFEHAAEVEHLLWSNDHLELIVSVRNTLLLLRSNTLLSIQSGLNTTPPTISYEKVEHYSSYQDETRYYFDGQTRYSSFNQG